MGGSGSGTTTLGSLLSESLRISHFDADSYFWESTDPPFTTKRPIENREKLLIQDLDRQSSWVLSGSIVQWAESIADQFTHVIFLSLPEELRIERLRTRERQKFGARLDLGGDMHRQHLDFIEWAKRYDQGGSEVRSKQLHEKWLRTVKCPVIRISGEVQTVEQVQKFKRAINSI